LIKQGSKYVFIGRTKDNQLVIPKKYGHRFGNGMANGKIV
jgi:hypothetical protein